MAVQVDETAVLDSNAVASGVPVRSTDFINLFKRVNASEEMIEDYKATGAAAITVRGHDHDPSSADTPGRGIMRIVDGNFQLSYNHPMTGTTASAYAVSMASFGAYSGMYETSGAFGLSAIMGKLHVSPGIESIRVEICWKASSLAGSPRFRVKNLTATTAQDYYGSGWIAIDTTAAPRWYGVYAEDIAIVPVVKSTSIKEVDLDIEVSVGDGATSTEFSLYGAFPYEADNEL